MEDALRNGLVNWMLEDFLRDRTRHRDLFKAESVSQQTAEALVPLSPNLRVNLALPGFEDSYWQFFRIIKGCMTTSTNAVLPATHVRIILLLGVQNRAKLSCVTPKEKMDAPVLITLCYQKLKIKMQSLHTLIKVI